MDERLRIGPAVWLASRACRCGGGALAASDREGGAF